jgi:YD repeat-containing protein
VNTQFLFDRENRLKKRTDSDGTVMTNTYDGDGLRRTRQKQGETVVTYIWDGSDYLGEVNT